MTKPTYNIRAAWLAVLIILAVAIYVYHGAIFAILVALWNNPIFMIIIATLIICVAYAIIFPIILDRMKQS